VILRDGTISEGWVGGGCACAAVLQAARDVLRQQGSRSLTRPEQHRAADDDRICYHPKQHYDRKLAPLHLLLAMHPLRRA